MYHILSPLQNLQNCELNFPHSSIMMNFKITSLLITFVIFNCLSVNVSAFQKSESDPYQNNTVLNSTRNRTQSPKTENNETSYNAPCSILGEKCAFENSVCVVNNGLDYHCQCDGISYYEGPHRMCRKNVGASCGDSEDCINYADCRIPIKSSVFLDGKCDCTEGFTYDKDKADLFTCYSITGNHATSLGENCTNLYEPCAFSNSMCVSDRGNGTETWSRKCECDDVSIDEGGGDCKKIIGTICETGTGTEAEECITNAECAPVPDVSGVTFGFCHCIEGYSDEESGFSKCTPGGSGSGNSEFLVSRVNFFLVVFPFLSRFLLYF